MRLTFIALGAGTALALAACTAAVPPESPPGASPQADAARDGQWAFRIPSSGGWLARAVEVQIAVECVVARDAAGRPTRTENRLCGHRFAEGTIESDVAFLLATLLREQVAGLDIQVQFEPGSESVFVDGADLAGIAGGSADPAVVAVAMACTVGPSAGRALTPSRDG